MDGCGMSTRREHEFSRAPDEHRYDTPLDIYMQGKQELSKASGIESIMRKDILLVESMAMKGPSKHRNSAWMNPDASICLPLRERPLFSMEK
jgi:hypothetical protein